MSTNAISSNPATSASTPSAIDKEPIPPATYLTPPPANAHIPPVPAGFVPQSGTSYRAFTPKKSELVALPLAIADLRKFATYAAMVGVTAPPYEEVLQTFDVSNQWSTMRTSSEAWDVYCRDQEGICWQVMRPSMLSLKTAFDLAAARDPSLLAKYPGLAAFLAAKRAIGKKGVATRRANKKAVAEGKAPTHGEVGRKRKKAGAVEKGTGTSADAAGSASVGAGSAPAVNAPPVASSAPPPASGAASAPPAPTAGINGVTTANTNGTPAVMNGVTGANGAATVATNGAAH